MSEPVGDGQQQVVLLQGLHPAERLFIQGVVAAPSVVQQLLLGRVELAHVGHLLRGHQEELGDGCGGRHSVAVHAVNLEGFGHVFQPLVSEQDFLVTKQHAGGVFH